MIFIVKHLAQEEPNSYGKYLYKKSVNKERVGKVH